MFWHNKFDVANKLVVVAGGSKGLGKAMALQLAAKGANLLILARDETALNRAREDIQAACVSSKQIVDAISVDLTQPDDIARVLTHYHPPDMLICTAGGALPQHTGFLTDLSPSDITSCLELNYLTTVSIVQYCLKLWLATPRPQTPRHIVLTSSASTLTTLPGYAAYTPAKAAIRALADTLRQELFLYGKDTFRVHCAFPGPFCTDSFVQQQTGKPRLTKMLEGTDAASPADLGRKLPSADQMARRIVNELEWGKTYITADVQGEVLLSHMRGPSPRFWFWGLYEVMLGMLGVVVWFFMRRGIERRTRKYGREEGLER